MLRWVYSALFVLCAAGPVSAQRVEMVTLRGHRQSVHVYGTRGGPPVVVSSGDGGWIHLGPHVAEVLASRGYFVLGFDVKAYLSSFTSGRTTLTPEDEPGDYQVLADFAARGSQVRPVLIGVSEGAGLSVLAATDPTTRGAIGGVPDEPTFSVASLVARMAPAPLAAIHSTHDEFVPLADVQRLLSAAREPKKLWVIGAADHRFSDNLAGFDQRLLEALAWIDQQAGR